MSTPCHRLVDSIWRSRRVWVLGLLATAVAGQAQPEPELAPRAPVVAVLGASVSGGFVDFVTPERGAEPNGTISVAAACRSIWPRDRVAIRDYSDVSTFLSPSKKAGRAVEKAKRARPDLVIGIDFMFWFGYGSPGWGEEGGAARLTKQQRGFDLLDQFDCPMIIGDYPEIRDADRRMLPGYLVPDPETLKELNDRLHAWAKERPRVHVVGLAEWVRRVKAEEEVIEIDGVRHALPSSTLMQTDRLHATRLGVVLLLFRTLPVVRDALPAEHALLGDWPTLGELLERTGADVELPEPDKQSAGSGR